jgi:peptidoglycan/xylan/chitin deacetylase (PgdA/CDA1 family)
MKTKRLIFLLASLSISTTLLLSFFKKSSYPTPPYFIQKKTPGNWTEAVITPFKQDAEAAVSITLDDGKLNNYVYALPIFEKYEFKATFSITTSVVRPSRIPLKNAHLYQYMDWNQIKSLSDKGHEVASHSVFHIYFDELNSIGIYNNIYNSKVQIEEKTGKPCVSFVYPGTIWTEQSQRMIEKVGYVCARTGESMYNDISPDFYALKSFAIMEDDNPSLKGFSGWVSDALSQSKWLILMYHNVLPEKDPELILQKKQNADEYLYNLYPSTLDAQMKTVKNSGAWVAPMGEVAKYLKERIHTRINSKLKNDKLELNLKDDLPDEIYNTPLTLKIKIPWNKVKVEGALKNGEYIVKKGFLLIDADPDSNIEIKNAAHNPF